MHLFYLFFGLILTLTISVSTIHAQYYGESGYYSEGSYYGEGSYGGNQNGYEGGYQGSYQGSYYGQGSYQVGGSSPTYSIIGYVYSDDNNNGGHDASDTGLTGETIQLLNNSNGSVVSEGSAEGSAGYYSIINILAGGYTVSHKREPIWPGWVRTTPRQVVVNLNSNSFANFGFKAEMKGYVFEDNNHDFVFNSGDVGLWLETVQLLNNSTGLTTAQTQTNASGYYLFPAVPYNAGGYTVRHSNLPSGWTTTTPPDQPRGMLSFSPASFGLDNNPTPPPPSGTFYIQSVTPSCTPSQFMNISWIPYPSATASTVYRLRYRAQETNQTPEYSYPNTYAHNPALPSYSVNIPVAANNNLGLVHGWHYEFIVSAETPAGNPVAWSNNGSWSASVPAIGWKTVNCTPTANLSATPNPCTIPLGQTTCSSTLSWDTTNISSIQIYRRSDNSLVYNGSDPNDSTPITVDDIGAWYDLWDSSSPISSLFVEGNYGASSNPPTVTLRINSSTHTDPPASVNQNTAANIYWTASSATTCYSSLGPGNPAPQPNWTSATFPLVGQVGSGGPISLNTSTPGTYLFYLSCANGTGNRTISKQMDVEQYPKPYIQTTGGDIHTNETIYIGN